MKDRIKLLRATVRMTQEEFANRLGIKRGAIANYEIGRNAPVDSVIALICREFSVNETWLRTGEGEMFEQRPPDEVTALAQRYGLTAEETVILEKSVQLRPEVRARFVRFVLDVADEIRRRESGAETAPRSGTQAPRAGLYRR